MRLHLGCGTKYIPGYTHIDIEAHDNVDIVEDISKLKSILSGSVTDIYACHVLEHFGRKEIAPVLKEWCRVLKKGGSIHLAVPDFEASAKWYIETGNISQISGLICGGQRNEYDYHKVIFDEAFIRKHLEDAGFCNVKRYDAKSYLPKGFDDYSRSYLPHMDFENGKLMSLNIMAYKE